MKTFTSLKSVCFVAALILSCATFNNCFAQSKSETINSAYFLTFGRYATAAENKYWASGNTTFAQLVSANKTYLKSSASEQQATIQRAFVDAFGWNPGAQEYAYFTNLHSDYAEVMSFNMNNTLAPSPEKRSNCIKQSYYKVFNRLPTQPELTYWLSQPLYSFAQLVAFHSSWKAKNAQTSTVGSIQPGLNVNGIMTAALSAGTVANLVASGGGNLVASGGGNLVASGAGNLVASGGGN